VDTEPESRNGREDRPSSHDEGVRKTGAGEEKGSLRIEEAVTKKRWTKTETGRYTREGKEQSLAVGRIVFTIPLRERGGKLYYVSNGGKQEKMLTKGGLEEMKRENERLIFRPRTNDIERRVS